ncbi:hypothetical protein B0H67DRAFT_587215 [Lasiosphaeris hirsuta]|uniref:Uncharacterized protein n=1 Tax=Lasiosphaeris hirsuta TaxID=260670 RepID=A0AA40A136_9PEZI|nr:hypothetical protein B0H67DRAFT_587215 [Lasiosphaeris hirsuta]
MASAAQPEALGSLFFLLWTFSCTFSCTFRRLAPFRALFRFALTSRQDLHPQAVEGWARRSLILIYRVQTTTTCGGAPNYQGMRCAPSYCDRLRSNKGPARSAARCTPSEPVAHALVVAK